jgi:deoxyuridine 5'-triphosphate nucleotidohydrolase
VVWEVVAVASHRRGSHTRIIVTCEFRASPSCKNEWSIEERLANETRAKNDGKIVCSVCSRALKRKGRTNPDCRTPDLDDRFFETIDGEHKAYLLGWIASDGAIKKETIAIYSHEQDQVTLRALRDLVCASLPLKRKKTNLVGFAISSQQIASDVCRWLDIRPGKKDSVVAFPRLDREELGWAFLRGIFDGDGCISSVNAANRRVARRGGWPSPRCSITSHSTRLLDEIAAFSKVPAYRGKTALEWQGTNALDFLGKLYTHATISLTRKHDLYLDWCCWVPGSGGPGNHGSLPLFRWVKTRPDAVAPSKGSTSDSGFDLTLLDPAHRAGPVTFYKTGIRVQPAFGWYFDVVPRSSIAKSGYMLANSVGVIDRGYTGEILVPLIKIDPNAPELRLPARLVQMIPRQIIAAQLVEVEAFDDTARGAGGFGSTG